MISESLQTVLRVSDVLEELGIPYHLGGSFARSIHGVPRQTQDLDLVVDMTPALVPLFASRLDKEFYLDLDSIRRAVQRRRHFNLIHLTSGFKIDVFPRGSGAFDRNEFVRGQLQATVLGIPRGLPEANVLSVLVY
ncbi:MAG TPA: hypothetical protein VF756_14690 [Thermoanaerobaculia bacterium]